MKKDRDVRFVMSAMAITGICKNELGVFVKGADGLIGGVKVPGIDIFHYKPSDQESAMRAFGNAIAKVDIPTKYVFEGQRPSYGDQKANLAKYEMLQEDDFLRGLLERQRAWLEWFEQNLEERLSFVLFFDPDKGALSTAMKDFIDCLTQGGIPASRCEEDDFVTAFTVLLQGGF